MEPDREDREDADDEQHHAQAIGSPQWSPIAKTGKTVIDAMKSGWTALPQWSPIAKTGKTALAPAGDVCCRW